jgi:hypothetical protein
MGILSSLSGAKTIKKGTKKALAQTEFTPFSVDSSFGDARIDKEGITSGGAPGSGLVGGFEDLGKLFQGGAGSAPLGDFSALGGNDAFQALLGAGKGGAGGAFGQAGQDLLKSFGSFDQDAFAQTQLGRLNALAKPGEDSAASSLANRLFSQGRLGGDDTRSGVAFGELNQSQERAQTERALASLGLARDEASSRLGLAGDAATTGSNLSGSSIEQFLTALQGGQGVAETQAGLSESLVGRAVGATGGINQALTPEQQAIQNLLAGTQIKQTNDFKRADIITGGAQAAGAAKGALTGGLVAGASSAIAFSDPRLKADVKLIDNAGKYNVYEWRWNENANAIGLFGTSTGVMADEVPYEVIGEHDGYLTVDYSKLEA